MKYTNTNQKNQAKLSKDLLDLSRISRKILNLFILIDNKCAQIFPSYEYMAAVADCTKEYIRQVVIPHLVEIGAIRKIRRGMYETNLYILHDAFDDYWFRYSLRDTFDSLFWTPLRIFMENWQNLGKASVSKNIPLLYIGIKKTYNVEFFNWRNYYEDGNPDKYPLRC